jgi:hypothetical protein
VAASTEDACSITAVGVASPPSRKLLVSWQLVATSDKNMLVMRIAIIDLVFTVTDSVDVLLLL